MKAAHDDTHGGEAPPASAPDATAQWVVFCLDMGRYALPLTAVDRIVRAAQFTPLPLAPPIVLGAIDVEGHILPVFNLRRRFQLPERPVDPSDLFLIAHTTQRTVVLVIDAALGVVERSAADIIESAQLTPDLAHIRGVMRLPEGLVLIQNLELFLSPAEAEALDQAVHAAESPHAG